MFFLDYTNPEYLSSGFYLFKEDLLQYGKDEGIAFFDNYYQNILNVLKSEMDKNKDCQSIYKKYEWIVKRLEKNIPKARKHLIEKTQQEMHNIMIMQDSYSTIFLPCFLIVKTYHAPDITRLMRLLH